MSTDNTPSILITFHLEYHNTLFVLCPFLVSSQSPFTGSSINYHINAMLKENVFKMSSKELKIISPSLSDRVKNFTFLVISSFGSFLSSIHTRKLISTFLHVCFCLTIKFFPYRQLSWKFFFIKLSLISTLY